MRRATTTTGERADNLEQAKRFKKHVNECVRRANTALQEAGTLGALFSPAAVGVRAKLRDACERVMLMFPGSQDHQLEETLWRKVYYQPLHAAKEMRKGTSWSNVEAYWVNNHLWDGVAFYHSLLHSIAPNNCLADFIPHHYNEEEERSGQAKTAGEAGNDTVARCLTCLGDLTRYMLDLPSPPHYRLSSRYYLQALHYIPDGGLIHSNLATVYSTNDQPLLAVAHYLRALTCEKIFEGAEGNLKRLLSKSRSFYGSEGEDHSEETVPDHHKMFLHTVLTLTAAFINNRSTEEIASLCQDMLVQLGKALETYDDTDNEVPDRSPSPHSSTNGHHNNMENGKDSPTTTTTNTTTTTTTNNTPKVTLTPEVMVIVCTVFSLCTKRLEKQGSSHTSMAQALMVSVLMTLISHVSSCIEQRISLIDPTCLSKLIPQEEKSEEDNKKAVDGEDVEVDGKSDLTNDNAKKKTVTKKNQRGKRLANIRRRRMKGGGGGSSGSQDEDSYSDGSGSDDEGEKDDEGGVLSSEEEGEEEIDLSQLCSSEDDESDEDVKIDSDQEWEGLTAGEHLELISKEGMLSAVFVACNWMKREDEVIQLCVKTANSLWTAMAKLLNLLRMDLQQLKNNSVGVRSDVIEIIEEKEKSSEQSNDSRLKEYLKKTPLPEDLMLHTLIPSYISWTDKSLNLKSLELVLLRTHRLNGFGQEMSRRQDTPLWLDEESGLYTCSMERVVVSQEKDKTKKNDVGTPSCELSSSPTDEDLLSVPPSKRDSRRLAGMQSLTAQWLQHEVRSLEERTRRATLGLYLVPDASVLINHLQAIQLLLSKPTHMIIIPQAVIGLLDQQKRESLGARNAIRWLEIKFRHGSRFIRSQRPHERTHLPLIKYPKRKDKEAWEWYQIVECCNYLSAQVQQNSNNVKTATVTLLTGEKHLRSTTFSHSGLTHAAGAVLKHIEEFMSKWQTSTKGHS